MRRWLSVVVGALGWAGCGGPREAIDAAQVCVGGADTGLGPVELADGDELVVTATASAGCHTADLAVSCEVALEGPGALVVTTETTWVRTEPLAVNCESILFLATATCASPALPAGSYTLSYAGAELAFAVPGTAVGCLE